MENTNKIIILNTKQYLLTKVFSAHHFFIIDTPVTLEELEKKCNNDVFLNMELLIFHLEAIVKTKTDDCIKNFLCNQVQYEEIITPLSTISNEILNNFAIKKIPHNPDFCKKLEEKNINIHLTEILSHSFLIVHKIHCIFGKIIGQVLLMIMQKESFLLEYLQRYILHYNLYEKKGSYLKYITVFNNIEEAVTLLENNKWIIKTQQLYESLKAPLETNININLCNCHIIDRKNISKEFYFQLKTQSEKLETNQVYREKRHLNLKLEKEYEITNSMEFYKAKILKCKPKYSSVSVHKNQIPSIKRKKISDQLYLIY